MEKIKVLAIGNGADFTKAVSNRPDKHDRGIQEILGGSQSLVFVTNQVPDVIIMDIETPEFKSLEPLRQIKRTHPKIQVILLAGRLSGVDKMAAYFYGAWAILEKPVTADALLNAIFSAYPSGHKGQDSSVDGFPPKPGQRHP